jgi:hypothetical protein
MGRFYPKRGELQLRSSFSVDLRQLLRYPILAEMALFAKPVSTTRGARLKTKNLVARLLNAQLSHELV